MWNVIKQAGEHIFSFFLWFQRTQKQMNLSNKILFSFFPKKEITLSSCAALLPTPRVIRVQHQLAIIQFCSMFLWSQYQIADYNHQPSNALNLKAAQCKVNPCAETLHTKQNKRLKQRNAGWGKRMVFSPLCRKELRIVKQQPYLSSILVFYGIYAALTQLRIHLKRKFWLGIGRFLSMWVNSGYMIN